MNLMAENLASLTESTVTVSYDPKVLEFRRALPGEFLKRGGAAADITVTANPAVGQVELRLGRKGPPASGAGVLASLFFRAKASGISAVEIQQPTISGADGKPISVTTRRGQVRVR